MTYNRNQKHKNHPPTNQRDERPKKQFRKRIGRHEFYIEGCPTGVKVPDGSQASLERALKYLKRQLKDSETMMKYKAKMEYLKPSKKRRVQKDNAIRDEQYKRRTEARKEKGYVWTAILNGKAI